jgi:hypothetical protein
MRRFTLLPLLFVLFILPAAAQDYAQAVRRMQHDYPEMRLQDVYKSFYQDRFGPGHMVSDSAAVYQYLQRELQQPDNPRVLFEPTGAQGRFYRIHLANVQKGYITAEELNRAFIQSANRVVSRQAYFDSDSLHLADTLSWTQEWHEIVAAIEKAKLKFENYESDKQMIEEMLATEGDVPVHHSRAFNEAYHPHYRIVRAELAAPLLRATMREGHCQKGYRYPVYFYAEPTEGPYYPDDPEKDRYSSSRLIIMVDTAVGKKPLLKAIRKYGAELKWDYKIIPGVAILKPARKTIEETMEYFRKVEGVISVERDELMHLH